MLHNAGMSGSTRSTPQKPNKNPSKAEDSGAGSIFGLEKVELDDFDTFISVLPDSNLNKEIHADAGQDHAKEEEPGKLVAVPNVPDMEAAFGGSGSTTFKMRMNI